MNSTALRDVGTVRFLLKNIKRQWHKRILKTPSAVLTPAGDPFFIDCNIQFTMEIEATDWAMDWGAETICILSSDVDRIFVDVGGNIGYYTSLLAPFYKHVYCFEPDDKYVATLRRNIERFENVTHEKSGVFSVTAPQYFESPKNMSSGGLVGTRTDIAEKTEVAKIDCVSLDDFFKSVGPVGLIKIDTDGSEMAILQGAASIVARDRPVILTEYSHRDDWQVALDQLCDYCAANQLVFFAFVRDKSAAWSEPVFRRLPPDQLDKHWWKMLFLVPAERASAFSVYEGTKGHTALGDHRAAIAEKRRK